MTTEIYLFILLVLSLGVTTEILIRCFARLPLVADIENLLWRLPYVATLLVVFLLTWKPGKSPQHVRGDLLFLCAALCFLHEMVLRHLKFEKVGSAVINLIQIIRAAYGLRKQKRRRDHDHLRDHSSGSSRLKSPDRFDL